MNTFDLEINKLYFVEEFAAQFGYILREPFQQIIIPSTISINNMKDWNNALPIIGRVYGHTNIYACSMHGLNPDEKEFDWIFTDCEGQMTVKSSGNLVSSEPLSVVEVWEDMSYRDERPNMWGYKFVHQKSTFRRDMASTDESIQADMIELMRPTLEDSKKYLIQ